MVQSFSRAGYWLAFTVGVLYLSVLAAPRSLFGQGYLRSSFDKASFPAPIPREFIAVGDELTPEPPSFTQLPVTTPISSAPLLGTAQAPHYWIVSSRCDVQHRRHLHLDDGNLDVYQRTPDGQLSQTHLANWQAQLVPGIPVVVCIHGSFVRWEDECIESHATYQWLRNSCPQLPLQVVFFTWPSEGMVTGLLPMDIAIRGKQAEFNGFHVARMMNCIPANSPVAFIGHSLGCRVILSTLHLAGGGDVQGMVYPGALTPHRYRAVFAAAAVDHNWMNPGQRYECALPRTECIALLRNQKDLALAFYPLHRPFAGRALSRSGLTRRDTRKLGVQSQKIVTLDVTMIEGHNHLWPGYFCSPSIGAAIAPYVYYPDVNSPLLVSTPPPAMLDPYSSGTEQQQRIAPPPSPTPATPEPVEPQGYNPPVDDFTTGQPPGIEDTTAPLAPQLVPLTP